jgi:hypothetical protein
LRILWVSLLAVHFGSVIDEVCLIRSMTTDAINHNPAHMFMNTGSQIASRPSMGSWVTYGLGTEAENLPGFVVLTSLGKGGQNQPIAARQWSSWFLPSRYQGVQLRSKGDSVLYLTSPAGWLRVSCARSFTTSSTSHRQCSKLRDCHTRSRCSVDQRGGARPRYSQAVKKPMAGFAPA